MPNLDGTGPRGKGSLTGRGMGTCNNNRSFRMKCGFGRKMKQGLRRGFGHGHSTIK